MQKMRVASLESAVSKPDTSGVHLLSIGAYVATDCNGRDGGVRVNKLLYYSQLSNN